MSTLTAEGRAFLPDTDRELASVRCTIFVRELIQTERGERQGAFMITGDQKEFQKVHPQQSEFVLRLSDGWSESLTTLRAEIYYLEKFLSLVKKGRKILDVGCGPGIETKFIIDKGFRYEGIGLSQNMIEMAKKKNPTATFQIMDMLRLNYPSNNFDGITALESLIHIPKYEVRAILTGFRKILRPDGTLLLVLQKGK